MHLGGFKPLGEQEEYQRARERFQAYYQVLKVTLPATSLNIVDEMLKARDDMETQQSHYWYGQGLAKSKARDEQS